MAIACLVCVVSALAHAQDAPGVVHVFVALCDNEHQGIQRVPAALGDGEDPAENLYWGAMYGVKTLFTKSDDWTLLATVENPSDVVLERLVFKHATADVYLVADAYKGSEIKQAVVDFLDAASGEATETVTVRVDEQEVTFAAGGAAELVVYVGHNGLMDFKLDENPEQPTDSNGGDSGEADAPERAAIVLCCMSKSYFGKRLERAGVQALVTTTGLMAPEAYTLVAALDGWMASESAEQIRLRAAKAYDEYQDCNLAAAKRLFGVEGEE
ncbi:MAG: hypothetical protein JW889_06110 [Verrucomicrobia bacterium]|nr:hypothetical protein [Verrucomicrobiota bacterium]